MYSSVYFTVAMSLNMFILSEYHTTLFDCSIRVSQCLSLNQVSKTVPVSDIIWTRKHMPNHQVTMRSMMFMGTSCNNYMFITLIDYKFCII